MNDESLTADKQALFKAIELWLQGQKQRQEQQKSNSEQGDQA